MHKIIDYLDDELKDLEKKVISGGKLTEREIEFGKNVAKFEMALLTNERMKEDGHSEGRRYHDMSYGGRYSYADAKDDMISDLHKLMRKAPTEETKHEFRSFIDRLERM